MSGRNELDLKGELAESGAMSSRNENLEERRDRPGNWRQERSHNRGKEGFDNNHSMVLKFF